MNWERELGGVGGSGSLAQVGQPFDEESTKAYRIKKRLAPHDSSNGKLGPEGRKRRRESVFASIDSPGELTLILDR